MNVFYVSTLGQLYQVHNIILNYGNEDENRLVLIKYTGKRNRKVMSMIREHLREDLFADIAEVPIPALTKWKNLIRIRQRLAELKDSYRQTLDGVSRVFVANIDNHYYFLCRIARDLGKELIFFEEGFNSYRFLSGDYYYREKRPGRRLLKWLIARILLRSFEERQYYTHREEQCWKDFDSAYVVFPELLKEHLRVKTFYSYKLAYITNQKIEMALNRADFSTADLLILSQDYHRYLSDEEFLTPFLNYLEKHHKDETILFKPHPRDLESRGELFLKEAASRGIKADLVTSNGENQFPVELVLSRINPRVLMAIDSSTILYASFLSPGTKAVSLVNAYLTKGDVFQRNKTILERFIREGNADLELG